MYFRQHFRWLITLNFKGFFKSVVYETIYKVSQVDDTSIALLLFNSEAYFVKVYSNYIIMNSVQIFLYTVAVCLAMMLTFHVESTAAMPHPEPGKHMSPLLPLLAMGMLSKVLQSWVLVFLFSINVLEDFFSFLNICRPFANSLIDVLLNVM